MTIEATESLRDTLSAAVETVEAEAAAPVNEAPAVDEPIDAPAAGETPEQAAQRARDEKGRFARQEAQPPADPAKATPEQQPAVQRPQRPSTWKKDYWDHWEKLDPKLAEYLLQREQEYARGVSTYKGEWESARPLVEAIRPFQQTLAQHGVRPDEWIQSLGQAQLVLATGTPEQKLAMLHQVAQQYGIPLDGSQPQAQQQHQQQAAQSYRQPAQQPALSQAEIDQRVQAAIYSYEANQMLAKLESNKEQFPHLDQLRDTMAGLLQSGLADDYESAYHAALRHPRHADLYAPIQQREREADEAKRRAEAAEAARNARAAAASPRTTTPTAASGANGSKKDLRSALSESFDAVAGGRV